MSKFTHPKGMTAVEHDDSPWYYIIRDSNGSKVSDYIMVKTLELFGFTQEQEEPTRIDDLYSSMVGLFWKELTEDEERGEFERRLLKYLPKPKKVESEDIRDYANNNNLSIQSAEDVIRFARYFNILAE